MVQKKTPEFEKNFSATNFTLNNSQGTKISLDNLWNEKEYKALLVMFICNHCPFVQSIAKKISAMAKKLKSEDILVVAIMSNDVNDYPEDSPENMEKFRIENDFDFHYLYDETQEVAKSFDAVCTPDFFGFNKDFKLQYRGRLDDTARDFDHITDKNELLDAMLLIAETSKGPAVQNSSIGCSIKWKNI